MDTRQGRIANGGPAVRLYDEVFALVVESRDYLQWRQISYAERSEMRWGLEITRLTARAIDMMAWALARKALIHAEIGLDVCSRDFCLCAAPVFFAKVRDIDRSNFPDDLSALLDRSLALYERIARLDANDSLRESESQLPARTGYPPSDAGAYSRIHMVRPITKFSPG